VDRAVGDPAGGVGGAGARSASVGNACVIARGFVLGCDS
jgi:hypothetical protein